MTPVQFRVRFPEFGKLPDPTIADAILRASNQTAAGVWGNLADEAIGYLAAHMLALSPYGQQARLEVKGVPTTTYMMHWKRLARMKACGVGRVAGGSAWLTPWWC